MCPRLHLDIIFRARYSPRQVQSHTVQATENQLMLLFEEASPIIPRNNSIPTNYTPDKIVSSFLKTSVTCFKRLTCFLLWFSDRNIVFCGFVEPTTVCNSRACPCTFSALLTTMITRPDCGLKLPLIKPFSSSSRICFWNSFNNSSVHVIFVSHIY